MNDTHNDCVCVKENFATMSTAVKPTLSTFKFSILLTSMFLWISLLQIQLLRFLHLYNFHSSFYAEHCNHHCWKNRH